MPITTRDEKGVHATSIWDAAYNGRKFDHDRAQLVNNRGDELKAGIEELLDKLSTPNRFIDEERPSNYIYPPEYKGPKPIRQQVQMTHDLWAKAGIELDINATLEFLERFLPAYKRPDIVEGLFATPRWQKIADSYNAAFELLLAQIAAARRFHNYRAGALGPEYLRQYARTAAMMEQMGQQQKGDILIIPAQFGLRHCGSSVRRAREVISANPIEFGACPFIVGSMALVHPERYVRWGQLHTDCPGGEYSPDADGGFSRAPLFSYDALHDRLRFGTDWVDDADAVYGSVSGFLPKLLLTKTKPRRGFVYFDAARNQPPSMRPISSTCSCMRA